jgi:hypothetical protein
MCSMEYVLKPPKVDSYIDMLSFVARNCPTLLTLSPIMLCGQMSA